MEIKTKIKNTIKIIIAIMIFLGLLFVYEHHKDNQRAEYAQINNCTWTIQGSHDICK